MQRLCDEMTDMKENVRRFRMEPDGAPNMPSEEFLGKIISFNSGIWQSPGRITIDNRLKYMAENQDIVSAENKDLFTACVQALRGMGYAKTRLHTDDDYETVIKGTGIGGGGSFSVGDLLQEIADKGGTAYPQSGPYPIEDVKGDAVDLFNETYKRLGGGLISNMVSGEMLLGLIQRAKVLAPKNEWDVTKDLTFTSDIAIPAIQAADGLPAQYIKIDKMSHDTGIVEKENTNQNQIGL